MSVNLNSMPYNSTSYRSYKDSICGFWIDQSIGIHDPRAHAQFYGVNSTGIPPFLHDYNAKDAGA